MRTLLYVAHEPPIGSLMMLNVRIHNLGHVAVLRCSGRLVLGEQTDLLRTAVMMSQATEQIVVLDFSAIDAIDASGAGFLASLLDWTRANRIEMKLMNASRQVQEVLELTDLNCVLDTWSCEDLASLLCGMAKPEYGTAPGPDRAAVA